MVFQKTINREVSATGIGLHSGERVHLTLLPEKPDKGLTVYRTDLNKKIKVGLSAVCDTVLAVTIGNRDARVTTIEHLLSCLYGLGIDNLRILVDGPEIPVMDGSAAPFSFLIKEAGICKQPSFKKYLIIKKPFKVDDGNRSIAVYPSDRLVINYVIDFNHPMLRNQEFTFSFSEGDYFHEISAARTFGFLRDVETLKAHGLAKGGTLENSVIIDDFRVINEDGLRYSDEFVRHKILDFIGDLKLVGFPILGKFVIRKSGHFLNHHLLNALLSSKRNYAIVNLHYLDELTRKKVGEHLPNLYLSDDILEDPFVFSQRAQFQYGIIENLSHPDDLNIAHPLIENMVSKVYLISQNTALLRKNRIIQFGLDDKNQVIVNLTNERRLPMASQKIDSPRSKTMTIVNIDKQDGQFVLSGAGDIKAEFNYHKEANKLIDDVLRNVFSEDSIDKERRNTHIESLSVFRERINEETVTTNETVDIFSKIMKDVPGVYEQIKSFLCSVSANVVSGALIEGLKKLMA